MSHVPSASGAAGADPSGRDDTTDGSPRPEAVESARRRRRAEVFGEVLPESTRDDRDSEGPQGAAGDEWLRSNVPPHHG